MNKKNNRARKTKTKSMRTNRVIKKDNKSMKKMEKTSILKRMRMKMVNEALTQH